MGNLWTVQQSNANLTSSGTALFRGNVSTLGQFLGDGGALSNVVYDINDQKGSLDVIGLGNVTIYTTTGQVAISGTSDAATLTTVSGYLQGQIDAVEATDVDSLNGLQGNLTLTSDSLANVASAGSNIHLSHKALTGSDGVTVATGTSTIAVTGFRSEFVSASGFLQTQLNNLDATYATDAELTSVSGHLQGQITTYSDHGNLSGLTDDDHLQYFRTSATAQTTRIVAGNDLLFQSDGSRGTPGTNTTISIGGATGNLDTQGTLRVRGLSGQSLFDGNVVMRNLTVTGTQTIFNTVTDVINDLLVSGTLTVGDPNTPFEDKLNLRGDLDATLDSSRSADTVIEITHQGAAGSWDIAGTNNLWHVTNQGNAYFQNINVTGTVTGIDHGQLSGLADDDHTQYILQNGTRAFTGNIQANASGTLDIGSSNTPFDEMFGTPVVREYVAVSGSPRRGMIAIDSNNQFVGYNGTSWIIIG